MAENAYTIKIIHSKRKGRSESDSLREYINQMQNIYETPNTEAILTYLTTRQMFHIFYRFTK